MLYSRSTIYSIMVLHWNTLHGYTRSVLDYSMFSGAHATKDQQTRAKIPLSASSWQLLNQASNTRTFSGWHGDIITDSHPSGWPNVMYYRQSHLCMVDHFTGRHLLPSLGTRISIPGFINFFLGSPKFQFINMHDSLPITPITAIHSIRYIINPLNYSSCIRVSTYPFITQLWIYTQVQYENLVSHIKSLSMHFLIIPVLHALSGDMQMLTGNFMGFFQSCD